MLTKRNSHPRTHRPFLCRGPLPTSPRSNPSFADARKRPRGRSELEQNGSAAPPRKCTCKAHTSLNHARAGPLSSSRPPGPGRSSTLSGPRTPWRRSAWRLDNTSGGAGGHDGVYLVHLVGCGGLGWCGLARAGKVMSWPLTGSGACLSRAGSVIQAWRFPRGWIRGVGATWVSNAPMLVLYERATCQTGRSVEDVRCTRRRIRCIYQSFVYSSTDRHQPRWILSRDTPFPMKRSTPQRQRRKSRCHSTKGPSAASS